MDAFIPILLLFLIRGVQNDCTTGFLTTCDTVSGPKNCADWRRLLVKGDGVRYENIGARNFATCPILKQLFVVGVSDKINAYAFAGPDLENLELEGNKLKIIDKNSFSGFTKLKKLSISGNGIEDIAAGAFESSTIDEIDLSNNKLSRLEAGRLDIVGLTTLLVRNNSLTRLDVGCFGGDLQLIDLSVNRLEIIDIAVFARLQKLQTLNLSSNELRHIVRVHRMSDLRTLDLSKNRIVSMEGDAFVDLPELRRLNLGYNNLINVYGSLFPVGSKLAVLNLHWNYLSGLFYNLGANLSNLREVTLGGNPWTCRCLQEIQIFLKEHNVESPTCDTEFFANGLSPVCINAAVTCNGSSVVGDENDGLEWRGAIKKYDC